MASRKTKKRVLVTGGGGFIGHHLTKCLFDRGYEIFILDRNPKHQVRGTMLIKGDVTNAKDLDKAMKGIDEVYHLAGVLGTQELQTKAAEATMINVVGSINVYDAALKNKTKVVLISKPNPWLNTYSITKETSEKFFNMYKKEFGLRGVIVKWFSVYGPGQKHYGVQKAVPTLIVKALSNEPLPVFGDGKQTADFVYVTDIVEATVDFAEHPKANGFTAEIGTGRGTSVNRISRIIIKLTHSQSKIEYLPMRMGEDPNAKVVADLTQIRKFIDYKPKVGLREGLKKTIDYYHDLLFSKIK